MLALIWTHSSAYSSYCSRCIILQVIEEWPLGMPSENVSLKANPELGAQSLSLILIKYTRLQHHDIQFSNGPSFGKWTGDHVPSR